MPTASDGLDTSIICKEQSVFITILQLLSWD